MAIWQYQIFIVPEEEVNSYFEKDKFISINALNEINWWKYRQMDIACFNVFNSILPFKKSWTDSIILFGDQNSNCIEILMDQNIIEEVSARIDLRYDYKFFVTALSEFAQKNHYVFLNNELKIVNSQLSSIEQDISNYTVYKSFLDKLK